MADKIKLSIDVLRKKNLEDFTADITDPIGKTEIGCGASAVAAEAAAFLKRAAECSTETDENRAERDYIIRNSETLRIYMLKLVDEDVKCRGPINKALKENRPQEEINACVHPASEIVDEIITMMDTCLDLQKRAKAIGAPASYLNTSAHMARCAWECAREYKLLVAAYSTDETFKFVAKRESEIYCGELEEKYKSVLE